MFSSLFDSPCVLSFPVAVGITTKHRGKAGINNERGVRQVSFEGK